MWKSLLASAKRRSQHPFTPASSWKTGIAALALGTLGALPAAAQLNYPTTNNTGTPTPTAPGLLVYSQTWVPLSLVPGSMVIPPASFLLDDDGDPGTPSISSVDDGNTGEYTLGFNFPLTGGAFNKIIINTNGYIKLGTAGMVAPREFVYGTSKLNNLTRSVLASTAPQDNNLIGVFDHDLDGTPVSASPGITVGSPTASYRFFSNADSAIIEWSGVHDYDYGTAATRTQFASVNFQMKLFPSGVVKFVYGDATLNVAATATSFRAIAGIRALSPAPTEVVSFNKGTGAWTVFTGITTANAGNHLIFNRNFAPTTGLVGGIAGGGVLARELRLTPNGAAVFATDASVLVYTLGSVPITGGSPHVYRARITNKTNAPIAAGGVASLTITGANPTGAALTTPIPAIGSGSSVVVDFPTYALTTTGSQTVTVTIPTDAVVGDNTSAYAQEVTDYFYTYGTASLGNAGGVGFNAAGFPDFNGEFIARFSTSTPKILNQARVDFQAYNAVNGQIPYQVLVFDNSGPGGTPGNTPIYASDTLLSPILAKTALISILPTGTNGLALPAGDFYVGLRQISQYNLGFSYEAEAPIRNRTFYYRSNLNGTPTAPFLDFAAAGSPFRFVIGCDLLDPTPLVPNCLELVSPVNLATNVPVRGLTGRIAFSSGGNSPTGYDVYLSQVQADVIAHAPSALISSNQQSQVYRFAPASAPTPPRLLYNTKYYYQVVARNAAGQSGAASTPVCSNETREFTTTDGPPDNDACATALALTAAASCNLPLLPQQMTTAGANEDAIAQPTCQGGDIRDVWYTFNAGSFRALNMNIALVAGPTGASAIGAQLFGASCASAPLGCVTNAVGTILLSNLTPNASYRLRIFTNATVQTPGRFTICLTTPPNLTVSTPVSTNGAYNNVIINSGGTLTMTGDLVTNNLTVRDGGVLITGASVASGNAFLLEAGGTLEVGSPDGISKTGTPQALTGSIIFNSRSFSSDAIYQYGPAVAGFTGNGLPSLVRTIETVNGTAFTTLTNPLSVRRMVRLGDADLAINGTLTAPGLTLLSNAAHTALVVNTNTLSTPGRVVGIGGAQRYISPALFTGKSYHHLSSPVVSTNVNDMTTGPSVSQFHVIVNPDYNDPMLRPTLTAANFPNVFYFDGAVAAAAGLFSEGYQSPASLASTMTAGVGYAVRTQPVTMGFVGTLQQGTGATRTVTVQVSRDGATDFGDGWNLLGNPYASPIDWDLVPAATLSTAGLASAIYVQKSVDATSAAYTSYTNGVGPTGAELLAMGQGFFVQKTSAAGSTFTFTNACRLTSPSNPQLNRRVETRPLVELTLLQNGQDVKMTDRTYVYFENGATADGHDDRYDAQKLPSTGVMPNLFTRANGQMMSINGLPTLTSSVTVPLAANVSVTGTYVLNAEKVINIPNGIQVFLVDALTGTTQNLSVNPLYTFQATAGNTTPRFTLQFRGNAVLGVNADQELANQLSVFPNPTSNQAVRVQLGGLTTEHTVALTLLSPLGQVVARQQVAVTNGAISTELDVRTLAKGLYTLRVVASGRSTTRTIVVQ